MATVSDRRARADKRERHERILRDLKLHAAIRVSDLARELGVTTETIRRDLDELGESGSLNRTYGGAALPPAQHEPAFQERQHSMIEERSRIGAAAADLVNNGQILLIDAGSTALHFARHLASAARTLTVITNFLPVATTLSINAAIRVILCPGDYNAQEHGVFGPHTIDFIRRFNADQAVIGASGLDPLGASEALTEAVGVKRAMMEHAQRKTLLVDAGKHDAVFLERVCPLSELTDIVTDRAPRGALADAITASGVTLHVAPKTKSGAR